MKQRKRYPTKMPQPGCNLIQHNLKRRRIGGVRDGNESNIITEKQKQNNLTSHQRVTDAELHRWHTQVKRTEAVLQGALGDLYGNGKIPQFCYSTGRVNWDVLSEVIGLPTSIVRKIAQKECRYLLLEMTELIAGHHNWLEKWIATRRLGLE